MYATCPPKKNEIFGIKKTCNYPPIYVNINIYIYVVCVWPPVTPRWHDLKSHPVISNVLNLHERLRSAPPVVPGTLFIQRWGGWRRARGSVGPMGFQAPGGCQMCHDVKTSWDFYHDFNNIQKPLLYMGVGSPEKNGLVHGYITGLYPYSWGL